MTVAVAPQLKTLAGQLRERGYNVVTYGKYKYPVDALVYVGSMEDYRTLKGSTVGHFGILMINATNKTVDEVDNALKNRLYSPLF
ncbi:MAG: YkuS family protein [Eubacteriales bacterium]|jgi:hypothetical protein|nr:YkuS family protein [Eubacteriales bacterium]